MLKFKIVLRLFIIHFLLQKLPLTSNKFPSQKDLLLFLRWYNKVNI